LRYFGAASSGEATWGVSLGLNTLPTAVYTFLLSWVLPPLREELSLWSVLPPVMLLAGLALFAVHALFVLRWLRPVERMIALICALTLLANGFSGWWWQAGNVKFYLFMQLNLLLLVALYTWAVLQNVGWTRRIGALALALMAVGLVTSHVFFTLPYETRGGVFTVKELADQRDDIDAPIWFESREQANVLESISDYGDSELVGDFCNIEPTQDTTILRLWWVVEAGRAADCAALDGAVEIGRFQADRSRRWWVIYELPPATTRD
ncbi:MAG: hypothetical protein H7175_11795, partial [Burkholderiales bacterium]|nr:hypothetical protein [Anaerolineae bacterium]